MRNAGTHVILRSSSSRWATRMCPGIAGVWKPGMRPVCRCEDGTDDLPAEGWSPVWIRKRTPFTEVGSSELGQEPAPAAMIDQGMAGCEFAGRYAADNVL